VSSTAVCSEQLSLDKSLGMREQNWLELKVSRSGWESVQEYENGDVMNTARKLGGPGNKNKSSKLNTSFTDIGIIDDDVEDKTIDKQSNHCQLATVGYSSDEECDDESENTNILQRDKTKTLFIKRRRFQLTIFLLLFISIFFVILFQVFFYWSMKDQKISQNVSIYSIYDII
jgi:hypothetical protein